MNQTHTVEVCAGNLEFPGQMLGRMNLVPKDGHWTFSEDWATISGHFHTSGVERLALWARIEINDSEKIQFRLRGKLHQISSTFILPTKKAIGLVDQRLENGKLILTDQDQNIAICWELCACVPITIIQARVVTAGENPAQILSACMTTSSH